jgi:hypothetical protein
MPELTHRNATPSPTRTYLVLVVGGAGRPRPLGTVVAPCRGSARTLARAIHADVSPAFLRVQAAGSASADLVARALAMDEAPRACA